MMLDQTETQGAPIMKLTDWLVVFLITSIPLVNIVMLFVWAFGGGNHNPNKVNFAKAALLWFLILFVLYFIFGILFGIGAFLATDAGY